MTPVAPVMRPENHITLSNVKEATFAVNQEQYQPLPALIVDEDENVGQTGTVITRWELTDAEIEEIKRTRSIIVHVMTFGHPLQPILLETESQFINSLIR